MMGGAKYLQNRLGNGLKKHTHALRAVPDFIIIGGMKCGSTALYAYLVEHPQILEASQKEVHFFDHPRYLRGLKWYRKHFPLKSQLRFNKAITGEASPSYIFHPTVAQRIHDHLPAVKLIAVLRNPVDRAFSHYQHTKRKGFEEYSFKEAIAAEPSRLAGEESKLLSDPTYHSHPYPAYSYRERGLYWKQLERYYTLFDRDQICILQSEALFADPQRSVSKVFTFLGLPPYQMQDTSPKNKAGYKPEITETHLELAAYFKPYNEKLYDLIGERFDWDQKFE